MAYLLRFMRLTARSVRAYRVFIDNPGPDFAPFGVESSTGSTWIDGREIFRTVVDMGTLADGSAAPAVTNVNHGIVAMELVTRVWGIIVNATPTWRNVPFADGEDPANGIRIDVNRTQVGFHVRADWTSHTGVCTIEYTKTP